MTIRGVVIVGDEKIILCGAGSEDHLEVTTKTGITFSVSRRGIEAPAGTQKVTIGIGNPLSEMEWDVIVGEIKKAIDSAGEENSAPIINNEED